MLFSNLDVLPSLPETNVEVDISNSRSMYAFGHREMQGMNSTSAKRILNT